MLSNCLLKSALTILIIPLSMMQSIACAQAPAAKNYFCAQVNGVYRTFARTQRGMIPMIDWESTFFKDYPPRRRCIEVSQRFQRFADGGLLQYVTTGRVNRLPVICVARSKGTACLNQDVLVTLKPGDNANLILVQMFDLRRMASGSPMKLSEAVVDYVDRQPYVSVEKFLELAPIEPSPVTPVESP